MGHLQAIEMRDHCPDREALLRWHLQANHYPPLPLKLVPLALTLITEVEDMGLGEGECVPRSWSEARVDNPLWAGQTLSKGKVMDALHLWDLVREVT